jgi:hypothetical protein
VISPTQTAFIKGRLIHDGALALHEILDEIKFSGQRAVILKLDFEKAYDRVSWAFLRTVLSQKGFEGGNVHRLMQLVTGAQTAIAINREWKLIEDRFEKRLCSWIGKLLSYGDRLILINSILTSLPMFMLSFFEIPKGVRKRLDFFRSRFFWQSDGHKKKYSLMIRLQRIYNF